jgi:hypothetical protein
MENENQGALRLSHDIIVEDDLNRNKTTKHVGIDDLSI